jgi:hypothetical protein
VNDKTRESLRSHHKYGGHVVTDEKKRTTHLERCSSGHGAYGVVYLSTGHYSGWTSSN